MRGRTQTRRAVIVGLIVLIALFGPMIVLVTTAQQITGIH